MRRGIYNDGRRIGLVLLDEYIGTVRKFGIGFVNSTLAACLPTAPLPTCTTNTLGTDAAAVPPPATPASASAATWLWADDRHFSAGGQNSLGTLAAQRAQNNPF
jgi:outer membrane lipase/esterase